MLEESTDTGLTLRARNLTRTFGQGDMMSTAARKMCRSSWALGRSPC